MHWQKNTSTEQRANTKTRKLRNAPANKRVGREKQVDILYVHTKRTLNMSKRHCRDGRGEAPQEDWPCGVIGSAFTTQQRLRSPTAEVVSSRPLLPKKAQETPSPLHLCRTAAPSSPNCCE